MTCVRVIPAHVIFTFYEIPTKGYTGHVIFPFHTMQQTSVAGPYPELAITGICDPSPDRATVSDFERGGVGTELFFEAAREVAEG